MGTEQSEIQTLVKLLDVVNVMNDNISGVKDAVSDLKVNIGKNNVILDQHHKRSTHIEGVVEVMHNILSEITSNLKEISGRVHRLDVEMKEHVESTEAELKPIKKHVSSVQRFITVMSSIPSFFKILIGLVTLATSVYGLYEIIVKCLN